MGEVLKEVFLSPGGIYPSLPLPRFSPGNLVPSDNDVEGIKSIDHRRAALDKISAAVQHGEMTEWTSFSCHLLGSFQAILFPPAKCEGRKKV